VELEIKPDGGLKCDRFPKEYGLVVVDTQLHGQHGMLEFEILSNKKCKTDEGRDSSYP
jgi:hypothetical protein